LSDQGENNTRNCEQNITESVLVYKTSECHSLSTFDDACVMCLLSGIVSDHRAAHSRLPAPLPARTPLALPCRRSRHRKTVGQDPGTLRAAPRQPALSTPGSASAPPHATCTHPPCRSGTLLRSEEHTSELQSRE